MIRKADRLKAARKLSVLYARVHRTLNYALEARDDLPDEHHVRPTVQGALLFLLAAKESLSFYIDVFETGWYVPPRDK